MIKDLNISCFFFSGNGWLPRFVMREASHGERCDSRQGEAICRDVSGLHHFVLAQHSDIVLVTGLGNFFVLTQG